MTDTRGGLPLWQRLMHHVLLAAIRDAPGVNGSMARMLELPVDLVRLNGVAIFAPAQPTGEIDMREWVTFARAAEIKEDDGLVFVDAPMAGDAR